MTGAKERALDPLAAVTREDPVPPDHVSRHLERALDLSFIRELVRGADADTGRPSVNPIVFVTLQLVLSSSRSCGRSASC